MVKDSDVKNQQNVVGKSSTIDPNGDKYLWSIWNEETWEIKIYETAKGKAKLVQTKHPKKKKSKGKAKKAKPKSPKSSKNPVGPKVNKSRAAVAEVLDMTDDLDEEDMMYQEWDKDMVYTDHTTNNKPKPHDNLRTIMPLHKANKLRNAYCFGRPAHYKTPKELQTRIEEYFKSGHRVKLKRAIPYIDAETGKVMDYTEEPIMSITDLCLFLGFESKASFYDYKGDRETIQKKDAWQEENGYNEFSYIIKRASMFIEREYEELLRTSPSGAIFALKNFDRSDKQELAHTGTIKTVHQILDSIIQ